MILVADFFSNLLIYSYISPVQDSNGTTEQYSNDTIAQDTIGIIRQDTNGIIETSALHHDEDNLKSKPTTCDIKITNLPTNSYSELESLEIEDGMGVTSSPIVLETDNVSSSTKDIEDNDDDKNSSSTTNNVIENDYAENYTHDTEYDINNENVATTLLSEDIVDNEGFEKTLTPDDLNEDENAGVEDEKCVTCSTELIIVFPSTITQHQHNNNLTEIVIPSKSQTASVSSITMDVGDDLQITPVDTTNDNTSISFDNNNTFHSDDTSAKEDGIDDENESSTITVDAMIDEEECVEAVQLETHTEPEISFDSFDFEEEEEVFSENIESNLHVEPLDSVGSVNSCDEPVETPTQTILPAEDAVGESPISEENEEDSNPQQTLKMADLIEEDDCVELVEEAVHEEPMNFDFLDENENDVDTNVDNNVVTKDEDVIEEESYTEVASNDTHQDPPEDTKEETTENVQTSDITTKMVEGYTYQEITEQEQEGEQQEGEGNTTIESGPPIVCNEFEGGDGSNGVAEWVLVDCTQEEVKLFHQHFLTNNNEVKKTDKSSCVLQ